MLSDDSSEIYRGDNDNYFKERKTSEIDRTSNAARVTQLDALELDDQIVQIVKHQLSHAFKAFPPYLLDAWEPEIDLLVRTTIWHLSIQKGDMSFGQQLLGVKYESLNRFKRTALIVPGLLRYLERRLECTYPRASDNMFDYIVSLTSCWIKRAISIGDFVNLLIFLRNGVYPSLLLRILGVSVGYAQGRDKLRNVGYSHLTRELLWHGFAELLMFVVPMINYHKIRRLIVSAISMGKGPTSKRSMPVSLLTTSTRCSVCKQRPVLPHEIGCSHVFCYYCIHANILADPKFLCPDCAHQADGPSGIYQVPTMVEHHF